MYNPFKKSVDISDIEKEVDGATPLKIKEKKKALEISIKEGSAASFSSSLGSSYVTPFALALNSNAFHIGLLSSFSGLTSPFAQLFGSKLMEKYSRKKIVLNFVLLEALMWLPIAFLSFLFWKDIFKEYLPYVLIILYSILVSLTSVAVPSWFSWMGDLVPEKDRGKYFSIRNRATGAVGLAAVLIGALILDITKSKGFVLLGFSILFALSFTFRYISYNFFRKQYSPRFKLQKGYYFSFFSFIKRFDNFGKFATYQCFFYLALMIASPFFTVYMLNELKFSYFTFMIVSMSSSVFYLAFSPLMGKFSDRFGNVRLLYISNIAFALTPILWIFFKSPVSLILIPQLISGIANATLVIAFTNFTYDSVSPQRRGICLAYTSILIGIGTFVGSIIGGIILNSSISFLNSFIFVFLISGILRFLTGIIFLPHIKEEKKVERLPPMHIQLTHPFKTLHAEIGWFRAIFR